jgi:hypothetical protein
MTHVYELVLETDLARGFSSWDSGNGRVFEGMQGDIDVPLALPTSSMPLYVQSLHDLDGDSQTDDTVVVSGTGLHAPTFQFEVLLDALTTPQSQVTPLSFVPVTPVILDFTNDGRPDLRLSELGGGPDRCYVNDGNGQLLAAACPPGDNYCTATSNSTGQPGGLSASGSASSAAGDLTLNAQPVPNQTGIFFHGANQTQVPFGNGFLCVSGNLKRGTVTSGSGNLATYTYDNSNSRHDLSAHVGSNRNFQFWFRDPMGGGAQYNTTNGLSILILP